MSRRELYVKALRKKGATLQTVADEYGVTRQAISQAINAERAAQARRRSDDRRARAAGKRPRPCSACGGAGHNSHCEGKGPACSSCGARNPREKWIEGCCPRCGVARPSRRRARR